MRSKAEVRFRTQCAALLGAALLLSGCAVGPNYHRPAVQAPTVFHGPEDSKQPEAQSASVADLARLALRIWNRRDTRVDRNFLSSLDSGKPALVDDSWTER